MRILVLHNAYAAASGEETSLDHVTALLASRGHQVRCYRRSSAEIAHTAGGRTRALLSGLFNPFSRAAIRELLTSFRPDVVFVKNLYPLISPSVLPIVRRAGVPIIMWVANYRLVCPNGLHLSHGRVCRRCTAGREYWCVLKNCENSLSKSFGYALRTWLARRAGWYTRNVSAYLCATQFMKRQLISAGLQPSQIHVVPNVVPDPLRIFPTSGDRTGADNHRSLTFAAGKPTRVPPRPEGRGYVGYVGRISREKGVSTLLRAATLCPTIQFRIAGRFNRSFPLPDPLPENVKRVGFLQGPELAAFFQGARIIVSPSECYETFGMTAAEAMLYARPVIASQIGVFPEWIRDGENGLLFRPGDPVDLAAKVRHLWNQPQHCRAMGRQARADALRKYSAGQYYRKFLQACWQVGVSAGRENGERNHDAA